jgi:F-type H+-transporting ATPase subunit epsilon
MVNTFHLEIVSPDRQVARQEVEELVVPAWKGYLGILPMHAPLLAMLKPGEVNYRLGGVLKYLAISGGYVEVLPEKTTLLVETAEAPEEIDVGRANASRQNAEKTIATLSRTPIAGGTSDAEFRSAEAHLDRAVVRIQVARRGHGSPASGANE